MVFPAQMCPLEDPLSIKLKERTSPPARVSPTVQLLPSFSSHQLEIGLLWWLLFIVFVANTHVDLYCESKLSQCYIGSNSFSPQEKQNLKWGFLFLCSKMETEA